MSSFLDRWTTPVGLGAYLGALNPRWGPGRRAVIEAIRPLTPTSSAITLRAGRGWPSHTAGQFVTVGVDVDGVRHHRCYSITSAPSPDRRLEIAVQARADGLVSPHLVRRARVCDVVELSPPSGDFTLPPYGMGPALFVSGGSGITPLMAMARALAARDEEADVVWLHHARSRERLMFADELTREVPGSIRPTVTFTADGGRRLDAARLDAQCADWREREVYACGPGSLLDFVIEHWDAAGLAHRVHLERFTLVEPSRGDGNGGSVRFSRSGRTLDAPGDASLLDVAERAGLTPRAGCRMGICHSCTSLLEAGAVRDLRDGRVVEAGSYAQLCVSAAEGDCTVEC